MKNSDFRKYAHQMVDYMADYLEGVEEYSVLSKVKVGEVKDSISDQPPLKGEDFQHIMHDFEKKIMPGITHWESPNFMAYFPASKSKPSILAEMLMSALGVQGMVWLTSPAATELEEKTTEWMRDLLGLSSNWTGSIQDTASTGTLNALLSAREKASNYKINKEGFPQKETYRIYASEEAHSSIEKNVKIAGFGSDNLVKIPVDKNFALRVDALKNAIEEDLRIGYSPLFVLGAMGTTGSTAVDPLAAIGEVAQQYNLWFHVDAAYSGAALICEEYRWMSEGIEMADSMVFNPHKWLFMNFDCSLYFVQDPDVLINTYSITPEYLKTAADDKVTNYRDWHIQLGRRFRSLKIWFVLRSFGVEKLQKIIRNHINWTKWLEEEVQKSSEFELLAPVTVNLLCFRFNDGKKSEQQLNQLNEKILQEVNASGKLFITHTKLDNKYTLRLVAGHPELERKHLEAAWKLIKKVANKISD